MSKSIQSVNAYRHVDRDDCETYHRKSISPLRPLWSVTQRQKEAHDQETKVEVVQDNVQYVDGVSDVGLHCLTENHERNIIVSLSQHQCPIGQATAEHDSPKQTKRK